MGKIRVTYEYELRDNAPGMQDDYFPRQIRDGFSGNSREFLKAMCREVDREYARNARLVSIVRIVTAPTETVVWESE